jgi:hypothetical protein
MSLLALKGAVYFGPLSERSIRTQHRQAAMDANGLVVMPGKGPVWKMAPGRSSTLKLRAVRSLAADLSVRR